MKDAVLERTPDYVSVLNNIFSVTPAKIALAGVISFLGNLFHVRGELVVLLLVLLALDWMTGLTRAQKAGEKITSYGLRRTGIKALEYFALSLAAAGMTNVFPIAGPLVEFVIGYLCVIEVKSIAENTGQLRIWHMVKSRFGGYLEGPVPDSQAKDETKEDGDADAQA